jgi:hypothetical protein
VRRARREIQAARIGLLRIVEIGEVAEIILAVTP